MRGIPVSRYFSIIIDHLNERLHDLCQEKGLLFLKEAYNAVLDPDRPFALIKEYTSDGAHFNYKGYEVLGNAISSVLEDSLKPGDTVLLVGDSITAGFPEYEPLLFGSGYGDERHSFGFAIRVMLDCRVFNKGISGDFTFSMAGRIADYFDPIPDLAILQGGANDAFNSAEMRSGPLDEKGARLMADTIFANFVEMVGECEDHKVKVAIIPLLPFYD